MEQNKQKRVYAFSTHGRVLTAAIVLAVLILALSLYNYYSLRNATEIESVDALSGQRIACCVGWESDYLLTPRKDLTLLRYETNADAIVGLSYGQVDAVAIDEITLQTVMSKTEGLEKLPGKITSVGTTFYTSYGAEEALAEFNDFAKEFLKSEDYQSFHDRVLGDTYEMEDIPTVTDGKKLVVGYVPDSYPESYIDIETRQPAGYGIEMMQRFAYARGYTIEWTETSETGALAQLSTNQIDFAACYVSEINRDDTEESGMAHMSAPYLYVDVYLMKGIEGQPIKITGEIGY